MLKIICKGGAAILSRKQAIWEGVSDKVTIGTLRSNNADGNENVEKTIGLISKTTPLYVHHDFLYIFLPVFARLGREHA